MAKQEVSDFGQHFDHCSQTVWVLVTISSDDPKVRLIGVKNDPHLTAWKRYQRGK